MKSRSLSKSKRKKGSMKTTHTIQDVEGLILERLAKLRDSNDKVEQKKLRSEILKLEKHFNDCNEKNINGKKYPTRQKPIPISKKDLLALIDSVEPTSGDYDMSYQENAKYRIERELDVSGIFICDDRTTDFSRTSILDGKFMK